MLKTLGLLILRLGTGLTLAVHGYPKLFGGPGKQPNDLVSDLAGKNLDAAFAEGGPDNFAAKLDKMDVPEPRVAALLSGIAELGGGLALALGFRTRLAALPVLFNLGVAIKKMHWRNGFFGEGGFEFPALLALSTLVLFLTGPGALSLDTLRGHHKRHDARKHDEKDHEKRDKDATKH